MGKATAATTTASSAGKAKTPISLARTAAAAKAGSKAPPDGETRIKSVADVIVIGKKKRPATSAAAAQKKQTASAMTKKKATPPPPPPVPGGWPVSSNLSYPAPRDVVDDDDDGRHLRPGALLRRSCNGSDVFLRKRAVQSTSASLPSSAGGTLASNGGGRGGIGGGGGGPTRFLIVFPGRVSLRPPPVDAASTGTTTDAAPTAEAAGIGGGIAAAAADDEDDDDGPNDDGGGGGGGDDDGAAEGGDRARKAGRRNPFAPAHPPRLLGKLVTLGGEGGRVELRIPFPVSPSGASSSSSSPDAASGNDPTTGKVRRLVMSGKAIPISGKYMALTFKRTGGAKESSSSGGGASGDRKRGTGSIACKDVFRSVIVLGECSLLDGDGKTALSGSISEPAKADGDGDDLEIDSRARMKHYGGSERTVDGGGICDGGVNGGRKRSLGGGGTAEAAAAPVKCNDSVSSKEIDDAESDASKDIDVGDESNDGDSSDVDEYVPTVSKKRKSTEVLKQRKAASESSADEVEDISTAKKRPPRRSVTATKVSYVDDSNESYSEGNGSDETMESGSDEDARQEGDYRSKSMPTAIQSDAKKAVSKRATAATAKNGGASEKRHKVKEGLVGGKSIDPEEDCNHKGKPRGKKPPAKKVSNGAAAINGATKKATADVKKSNDIIEIDCNDDDVETMSTPNKSHQVDETSLQGISADAEKRLSTASFASKSPVKSPISYGRRKKNSPKVEKVPNKGRENDLNLDDDSFTFL
jgi:hypothetical protein